MKKIVYKNIDEVVYETTLKNKMKVYLLYKKGFVEKNAYIVSKFGHFDSIRKIDINGKKVKIPYGAAHFLEHRMFSINDTDATSLFASLGASCNAYTTYEKTAYYFITQDNFYECLKILLTMMSSFTSSKQQIENEKSIILQEANMYKEEPNHLLNKTIFSQGYINHPINRDIIGTSKTIKETSYETLKAIYDTFYDPSNLTLIVAGDINHKKLERFLNDNLIENKKVNKITPLTINEPFKVKKEEGKVKLSTISMPRVAFMYKLKLIKDKALKDRMYFSYYFILDYLFASSGKLSEKWLNENIITTLLEYSITSNIDLDCIIFYNINSDVKRLVDAIKGVFDIDKPLNMTEEDLKQLKNTQYGITLRSYESVSGLCSYFVYDLFTSNDDFFKEIEEIKSITLEDINQAYKNICEGLTTLCVLEGD